VNRFQLWLLRKIARRAVIQGDHKRNIALFYGILAEAAKKEFTEDNKPTLSAFLADCNDQALSLFL